MAGSPEDREEIAAELIAELAAARVRIGQATTELRESTRALKKKLDVPERVSESFKKNRVAWLGGSAILGLLLSKIPARSKTVFVETGTGEKLAGAAKAGVLFGALKFAFGLAKPWLGDIAMQRVAEFVQRRNGGPPKG